MFITENEVVQELGLRNLVHGEIYLGNVMVVLISCESGNDYMRP